MVRFKTQYQKQNIETYDEVDFLYALNDVSRKDQNVIVGYHCCFTKKILDFYPQMVKTSIAYLELNLVLHYLRTVYDRLTSEKVLKFIKLLRWLGLDIAFCFLLIKTCESYNYVLIFNGPHMQTGCDLVTRGEFRISSVV